MDRYFRVFKFMGQVMSMGTQNPRLFLPVALNVAIAVPINIALCLIVFATQETAPMMAWACNAVGVVALYYTDYFCNGLACSMIYDQVTSGNATIGGALERTGRSAFGILVFATISGFFDLLAYYAQERDDVLGKILMGIVRALWTAATYVVMPSMIIEGLGFFESFKRSKQIAQNDPTGAGVGIVGMGLACYLISTVIFGAAEWVFYNVGGVLGFFTFFTLTNIAWAVTGYLRITYFTCYYLWARECAWKGQQSPALAPAPLAAALA